MRRALRASVRVSHGRDRPISGLDQLRLKDTFMKKASTGIPAAAFQAVTTLYGKIIFNKIVHLARAHNGHVSESLQ